MTTYIRYKDKIYGGITLSLNAPVRFIDGETGKDRILNKDEYKQADTIDELCDVYFAISNTNYKTPIKIDFEKKIIYQWQGISLVIDYTFEQFIPYHTIYGAIWTDKGLRYVAKMNKEGELELI